MFSRSGHSRSRSASASTSHCANGETQFSAIPVEIMDAHILTKLDGPTLASAACVSTQLNALCVNESLWMNLCNTTWPSITHPLVRDAISTFPSGYRSFFSNSFRSLLSHDLHHNYAGGKDLDDHDRPAVTTQLISAVDLRYKNNVVLSKVRVTDTLTNQFVYWPIKINVVDLITRIKGVMFDVEEEGAGLLPRLAEHLTLSWIVIDPTRKRAANFSSIRPVLVDVEPIYNNSFKWIRYATLMVGKESSDTVEFRISVTYGTGLERRELKRGELVLWDVNLQVLDMEGTRLAGEDGLINLQKAMARGCDSKSRRKNRGIYDEYEKYLKMKKEREAKKAKEMALKVGDCACIFAIFVVVTGWLIGFCLFHYILITKKKIVDYVSKYRH